MPSNLNAGKNNEERTQARGSADRVLQSVRLQNVPLEYSFSRAAVPEAAGKVRRWVAQIHFTVQHVLIGRCALPQPFMVPSLEKRPLACQLALPVLPDIKKQKEDDRSLSAVPGLVLVKARARF